MDIYLDHQTITPPYPRVVATLNEMYRHAWGTTDAPHERGQQLYSTIDTSLDKIFTALDVPPATYFALTGGGFDARLKLFLSFYLDEVRESGKNHLLASSLGDAPTFLALDKMEQLGCVAKFLPVNAVGQIQLEALEEELKPRTSLLSLAWANGLTGVVEPMEEISRICREKGVKIHVDASHMIGRLLIDWRWIDFLTFDGDKIGTPQGIGGVFQKRKPHDSLHNIPALKGVSLAVEETVATFNLEVARLRDLFEEELERALPGTVVPFRGCERLPHISVVAFPTVTAELLLYHLNQRSVFASMGGGTYQTVAAQLKKCGFSPEIYNCAVSFGLSHTTTEDEMAEALDRIVSTVRQLQRLGVAL